MLNKLRRWRYHSKYTTIPNAGSSGPIIVYDRGINKTLAVHNFTKKVELKDLGSLDSYYTSEWKVEQANDAGWSRITNPDGLFLTTKLSDKSSVLAVEKEGMQQYEVTLSLTVNLER